METAPEPEPRPDLKPEAEKWYEARERRSRPHGAVLEVGRYVQVTGYRDPALLITSYHAVRDDGTWLVQFQGSDGEVRIHESDLKPDPKDAPATAQPLPRALPRS